MSFLFGGRPQLSSEQKIAAAEAEIDMVSDMYSRYVWHSHCTIPQSHKITFLAIDRTTQSPLPRPCAPVPYRATLQPLTYNP